MRGKKWEVQLQEKKDRRKEEGKHKRKEKMWWKRKGSERKGNEGRY